MHLELREDPTGLFPALITEAMIARRDDVLLAAGAPAEGAAGLAKLGGGLYLGVGVQEARVLRPMFPGDLSDRATAEALAEARRGMEAALERGVCPIQLKQATVPVLTIGPSPLAASALATRGLFRRAAAALGSRKLCALVPHQERAFLFAAGDPASDRAFARALHDAETASSPLISSRLWSLTPDGIAALNAPWSLEALLFGATPGLTAAELRVGWPMETRWGWDAPRGLLQAKLPALPGMEIAYELRATGLRLVRLSILRAGPYPVLESMDAALRALLPSFELRSEGRRWSPAQARAQLEDPSFARTTPISAIVPGLGRLHGKAVAFSQDSRRFYGFDLVWQPNPAGPV